MSFQQPQSLPAEKLKSEFLHMPGSPGSERNQDSRHPLLDVIASFIDFFWEKMF